MHNASGANFATRAARLAGRAALVVAVAFAVGACGERGDAPRRIIALAECRLPKLALAAQCGELEVPEDRARPDGRRIRLTVAVLTANTLNPRPDPLFVLAGGPGQAATSIAPFAAQLTDVRRDRDIVLLDQRGTGRSSPLECAAFAPDDDIDEALLLDPLPKATACAAELAAKGIDAAQYTTAAFVADLDAVRAALGYDRINLWGGSYGTRAALEYMRRHGAHVRSAVLDGVAPPGMKTLVDVWPVREAALAAIGAACAGSPACRAAHPDLAATLAAIGAKLGPGGRDVAMIDPRTGAPQTARLTYDHVLAALQPLLYVPELQSLVPEAVGRAAAGDFSPLQALAASVTSDLAREMNAALHFSVTCAEDAPRVTAADRARALDGLPARGLAERTLAVCAVWPRGSAPADAATPVTSDIPVLLLSGGLDPVTPAAFGAEVAATLRNSRHIVAPGYGHIVSPHACGPRLIGAFIDDPGFGKLPPACVAHFEKSTRPLLWPDRLGAQP
jgi:pimeloyl-ACP methyl ester carboxylesterase